MNKTTKFINKLVADTNAKLIDWFEVGKDSHVFVNNETVVLKFYRDYDNTPAIKMYIVNRYTLYPKWDELMKLTMAISDCIEEKIKVKYELI